jgi:hypothetical protein
VGTAEGGNEKSVPQQLGEAIATSAASGGSALRTEHTLTGEARAALAHRSSTLSRKISAAQGSKQIWQA